MIFSENRPPSPDRVRGQAFSGSCSVQQRGARRYLVELVQVCGKVGVILMDGIEGEFLVNLGHYRSERRPGDLNIVVGEFVRSAACILRRIAAEIRVEGKAVVARPTKRRRCKRR